MNSQNVTPTYDDLVACIKSLRPYAASRAEDMNEAGGDECVAWQAANEAVQRADVLLENVN